MARNNEKINEEKIIFITIIIIIWIHKTVGKILDIVTSVFGAHKYYNNVMWPAYNNAE